MWAKPNRIERFARAQRRFRDAVNDLDLQRKRIAPAN